MSMQDWFIEGGNSGGEGDLICRHVNASMMEEYGGICLKF